MLRILAAGIAMLAAASSGAWACHAKGGAAALLDESFKSPDPGWGAPDDGASFTPNGLVLKPPVNGSAWRWNPNYSMDGNDLCVAVVNPSQTARDIGDAGIWFWSQNAQNFYTATLSPAGTVAIDRLVNGVWHVVVPPTPSVAVHTQPGATNEVEIAVHGNTGIFYVNGSKVADFNGEPPPKGGPPGVYGESGATGIAWVFPRVQLF